MRAPVRLGRPFAIAAAAALGATAVVGGCAGWVRATTASSIYSAETVPPAPVALVLGKLVYPDGTPSPLLRARLELARRLYRMGKVRAILVSGDGGSRPGYDEVTPMGRWLIERGVPARRIVRDPVSSTSVSPTSKNTAWSGMAPA